METIRKMVDHLFWANKRILETLQQIEGDKQELCRLFGHILYAEKVWMNRIERLGSSYLPLWSDVDIEVCEMLVKENEEMLRGFLNRIDSEDLKKIISYQNSTGKVFHNSIRDILTHVALHGQYHRGQMNARLRANNFEPISIDFISFVR